MKNKNLELLLPKLKEKKENSININKNDDIGNKYLQIDGNYNLRAVNEDYIENKRDNINKENNNYDNINSIISEVLKKINSSYEDIFDYSLKIAYNLNLNPKSENFENLIDYFSKVNQTINLQELNLNNYILLQIGQLFSYAYLHFEKYKIKDIEKLKILLNKAIKEDKNIFTDYALYCTSKNKNSGEIEFKTFFKKRKKNYDLPPELLILLNTYQSVTTVVLEINKLDNPELKDEDYKFFKIAILNLHMILKFIKNIKFNFISRQLEQAFYSKKRERFDNITSKIYCTPKPNDLLYNDMSYMRKKWDFSHKIKKLETKNIEREISTPWIEDFSYIDSLIQKDSTAEIIKNNMNLFELIFLCFFSLNFYIKNEINFELIMNNCYNNEYHLLLDLLYRLELVKDNYNIFNIFDLLLFNNIINNISKLNIEINCLDNISFKKILSFLYYNDTLTRLNISFFSTDINYIPESLLNNYIESYNNPQSAVDEIRRNYDENAYLFSDVKEFEDKTYDKLLPGFIDSLSTFFEIIKEKKKLKELGLNLDVPINLRDKSKYMNAIFKFIMNILFYVSKKKIERFCLISPYTILNSAIQNYINNLLNSINFHKNKYYEELTLQMQFYKIESITSFINTRVRILSIGNLDLYTFNVLCNYLSEYNYNKTSSLEKITIGLMGYINELNDDVKFLLEKLFGIKINSVNSLTLITSINITNSEQYIDLLELINYNWITNYTIQLDNNSNKIYNKEKGRLKNLECLLSEIMVEGQRKSIMMGNFQDVYYDAYFCMKRYLNNKFKNKPDNKKYTRKIIFDILKYLYLVKTPNVTHLY